MEGNRNISGSIPTEIGQASFLSYFVINDNKINGIIPTEMGNTKSLLDILMRNNMVSEVL